MYINIYYQGLYNSSFKALVSAQKMLFPAVAHGAERISNLNNSANSKQNGKKILYTQQELKWGQQMKKARGGKSHAAVPLKNYCTKFYKL
jgi:hypothetical protein